MMMGLKPCIVTNTKAVGMPTGDVCSEKASVTRSEPNQNPECHCLAFELKEEPQRPLNELVLGRLSQQIVDAMLEYKGFTVADLKLTFHSKSNGLQKAMQDAKASLHAPKIGGGYKRTSSSSPWKIVKQTSTFALEDNKTEDALLQDQIGSLEQERDELKKRLRECSAEVDHWRWSCEQKQERIRSMEHGDLNSSASVGSFDTNSSADWSVSTSGKKRGVSRTPLPQGPMSFPSNTPRRPF